MGASVTSLRHGKGQRSRAGRDGYEFVSVGMVAPLGRALVGLGAKYGQTEITEAILH